MTVEPEAAPPAGEPVDTPPDTPRRRLPWRRRITARLPLLGLLAILAGYAWFQITTGPHVYYEPDPDAYLITAKRLARFEPVGVVDADPYRYQRHMWVQNARGEIIAKYNPGFPFLLGIAWRFGGDDAMLWLSSVMGFLGIWGAWLLARQWMRPGAATLATATLAGSYMYLFYTGYMLTHAANLYAMVWGMYGLWRWRRRGGWWVAVLAALGIGLAVSVRYTSVAATLAVPCLVLARALLLRRQHADRARWRAFAGQTAVGLAIFAAIMGLLCWYHYRWFGSPFTTGYDLSDEQSAFTRDSLAANYRMLAEGLVTQLGFLAASLGFVGMVSVGSAWDRLARVAWFLPLYLIYAAYYWAMPAVMFYRFLIVAFPVIVLSGFLLLDRLPTRRPWTRLVPMLLVLLVTLVWTSKETVAMLAPTSGKADRELLMRVAHACDESLPADTVLFLQRPYEDYLGTRADYRAYDLGLFIGRGSPYETGRYAPRAQPSRLADYIAGIGSRTSADRLTDLHQIIADAHAAGRAVAILVPPGRDSMLRRVLGKQFSATSVATVPIHTGDVPTSEKAAPDDPAWSIYRIEPMAQ